MSRKTLAQQRAENDLVTVLSTEQGVRVIAGIMRQAGLLQGSFIPGDVMASAHAEGKRSIALMIYSATTSVRQGAFQTALMAEVMSPADVRNAERSPRDDADTDAE